MNAQNVKMYPEPLFEKELLEFSNTSKTEIPLLFKDKFGNTVDENVEAYKLNDLVFAGNHFLLIRSSLINKGYLCPENLVEAIKHMYSGGENMFSAAINNMHFFKIENSSKIDSCIKKLEESIHFECNTKNHSKEYFDLFSKSVNAFLIKKSTKIIRQQFVFNLFVFTGEMIKSMSGGSWEIDFLTNFEHDIFIKTEKGRTDLNYAKSVFKKTDDFDLNFIIHFELNNNIIIDKADK